MKTYHCHQKNRWSGRAGLDAMHFLARTITLVMRVCFLTDGKDTAKILPCAHSDLLTVTDILGDGTLHPYHLMKGPMWLRAFKGNEFQRLRRQLKYEEEMLQEFYPRKLHDIKKRMFFLYKRVNRRRRARFWAGRKGTSWTRSRFFKLDKVF